MDVENISSRASRRCLLGWCSAALASSVIQAKPNQAMANAPFGHLPRTRRLHLEQPNTGDKLDVTYMRDGKFDPTALVDIDHLMRDWRTGDVIQIDRTLLDLVYTLQLELAPKEPVHIISAYRTKKTNDRLRRQGRGAAKNSLHIHGMAIDLRIPGVRLKSLRRTAMKFQIGGVGYYPRSRFIHIDTGPVRYW